MYDFVLVVRDIYAGDMYLFIYRCKPYGKQIENDHIMENNHVVYMVYIHEKLIMVFRYH